MKLKLPASVADNRTHGGVGRSGQKARAGNYLAGRPPYSSCPSRQPPGPVSYSPTVAAREEPCLGGQQGRQLGLQHLGEE